MIPLIIETDLGRDPDDLFAILYLIATNKVDIKCILITPGDRDQVGIAHFIAAACNLDFRVGIPQENWNRNKRSSGGIHYALLNKYRYQLESVPDGIGSKLIEDYYTEDTQFFVCGPATNIARWYALQCDPPSYYAAPSNKLLMQGGFCPYSNYYPSVTLDKFKDKEFVPTFNFNGDRKAAEIIIDCFSNGNFVGKNVCHTIEYDPDKIPDLPFDETDGNGLIRKRPAQRAKELFIEASELYFNKHKIKKFHDPTAAVCFLHPEIGTWLNGLPHKMDSGWTTTPCQNPDWHERNVLVDIDRDKLWVHIRNFT